MLKALLVGCIFTTSALAFAAVSLQSPTSSVRMVVELGPSPIENVEIKVDGKWVLALSSAQAATRVVALGTPDTSDTCIIRAADEIPNGLLLQGDCGIGKFEQRVTLISDSGSGISALACEHIFDAFYTTKNLKASGIGLWLTSEVIARHEGHIHLRSRTEGPYRGTLFDIFLPEHSSNGEEADHDPS